jgi:hypothetical protein
MKILKNISISVFCLEYKYENYNLNLDFNYNLIIDKNFFRELYIIYDSTNGILVHKSTCYRYNNFAFLLGNFKYKVIGNCWTNDKYRGYGIYGKVLKYISQSKKKKVFLFVNSNNESSIKGLQKIGAYSVGKYRVFRFLKFIYYYKKS